MLHVVQHTVIRARSQAPPPEVACRLKERIQAEHAISTLQTHSRHLKSESECVEFPPPPPCRCEMDVTGTGTLAAASAACACSPTHLHLLQLGQQLLRSCIRRIHAGQHHQICQLVQRHAIVNPVTTCMRAGPSRAVISQRLTGMALSLLLRWCRSQPASITSPPPQAHCTAQQQ
jgi:hypothetical protein